MKHVMYAEKSLLMGDEVVDLMMEYAVLLARQASADRVAVHAISTDGDHVTATFLIGPATIMVAETARSALPEPDNGSAVEYLKEQIGLIKTPPLAHGLDDTEINGFDEEV
ncbi:hypothetical protein BH09ACT5_BH09ACT5_17440 [soil metagenome]